MNETLPYQDLVTALHDDKALNPYDKQLVRQICNFHQPSLRRHLLLTNLAFNSRTRIIEALGRSGSVKPKVSIRLMSELYLDDLLIKNTICDSLIPLGKLELSTALNLLRVLGMDPYPVVRNRVAFTVAALYPHNQDVVLNQVRLWSKSAHRELREISARVLGMVPAESEPDRLAVLIPLCADEYAQVRLQALAALKLFVPSCELEVLTALAQAARDSRWSIRKQVAITLEAPGEGIASEALAIIAGLVLDVVPEVARQAALSLKSITKMYPDAGIEALSYLARDSNLLDLDVLRLMLEAAAAIPHAYHHRLIPVLELLSQDDDAGIRSSAASVLSRLRQQHD